MERSDVAAWPGEDRNANPIVYDCICPHRRNDVGCLPALAECWDPNVDDGTYPWYSYPGCGSKGCGYVQFENDSDWITYSQEVKARDQSDQPNGATINANCLGIDKKLTSNLSTDFLIACWFVPASCAYKLITHLEDGPKKDQNFYLTPGCHLRVKLEGVAPASKLKVVAKHNTTDEHGWQCDELSKAAPK